MLAYENEYFFTPTSKNQTRIALLINRDTIVNNIIILALFTIINMPFSAQADQHDGPYSVQIAAYKILPDDFIESAEKYGSVHTSLLGELTRVSVGNFDDRSTAQSLLSQLKQVGYKDAFISRISSSMTSNQNPSKTHHRQSQSNPISEMAKFRNLPDADKESAVFIDGKLHLKEGNRFIPVP